MSAELHEMTGRRPRLRLLTLPELLALELPPREAVLDPWLLTHGLAMVYAPRGVGKTFFGLGAAYAIATGGSFLRWRAPEPRRVLYLDGEMAMADLQERLAALVAVAEEELPRPELLGLLTPDVQPLGMPDLATCEGREEVDCYAADADVIVVDNLSCLVRCGRENEGESWLPVQEWALGLRAAGKSMVLIHHAGKSGGQRGTSRREDVLDVVLALRKPDDYKPAQGARFEVHFEEARHLRGDAVKPFEAWLGTDEHGRPVWTMSDVAGRVPERTRSVVALLAEGLTQREVAERLKVGVGTVNRDLKKARELGLMVIEGGGGDGDDEDG